MSVADRLTKLTTDITNAYTSIENKGGTIPANKNTNNLPTAINSIEVIEQATAEGESLSLTNTKAMPYNDYVVEGKSEQDGEPSPSNPSEIHSVADDVNLLNLQDIENHNINNYYESITTDFQLEAGQTYTLSFDAESTVTPFNVGIGCGNNGYYQADILNSYDFQNGRISITFTPQSFSSYGNYLAIRFVRYDALTSYTYSAKNIKLQKGSTATPYSPYNQGTVTIKQRGKNLFDIENYSKSGYNVTITNPLKGLIAGDYTISCQNKHTAGSAIIFSNEINGSQIGGYFTGFDFGRTLTSKTRALTQEQLNAKYMIFQGQNSSISQEVLENMQIQIEEGSTATDYEPYQANDYTIQTEPLRSLPNGVKDTIETDGIHRRVGRYILPEFTALSSGTVLGTQCQYASTYSLPNSKTGGRNYNFISNIIAPANEIYGQYKGFKNSTNFVIMTSTDDTVENFNSKISGAEVLYELATEVIEPFTQQQATTYLDIIKTGSYEGTTNIYTDEDVKPTIGVDYYKKS